MADSCLFTMATCEASWGTALQGKRQYSALQTCVKYLSSNHCNKKPTEPILKIKSASVSLQYTLLHYTNENNI